uniref:Uncharacterized protein n=1 Tax=Rhizophora mucronata TaxID=61149 RepID=A0A2P2JFR9_RHIMU
MIAVNKQIGGPRLSITGTPQQTKLFSFSCNPCQIFRVGN